jgi:hypothetical protein
MKKKSDFFTFVLGAVLLFSIVMITVQNFNTFTGYATGLNTKSNVSISKYLSISASPNISDAIDFGIVNALPATNVNASHDYDGAAGATTYWINTSVDSNTNIDFCIGANGDMMSGADRLRLGNETYANATSTSISVPALASQVAFSNTSYILSGQNVTKGAPNYYRFWLDIPASQASGDYNNTVYFKAVATATSCGAISW